MSAYLFAWIASRRGAETWGVGFIVCCLILAGAYSMFPELFHRFFQWFLNGVFDALGQSFGSDPTSPVNSGPHPKNLTTVPKGTPAP